MSKYTATFSRNEIKFVFDSTKRQAVEDILAKHLNVDEYGYHTIGNIYLDNDYFESIITSQEKPLYKEKVRLRFYSNQASVSHVFLEVKKKFAGVVYKRRCSLTVKEANDYVFNHVYPDMCSQTFDEIHYVCTNQGLKPAMYIAYNRIAYTEEDKNGLRVTLDDKVRWRDTDLSLDYGDVGELLDADETIMEVKTHTSIPKWLVDCLSDLKIYTSSCSKYGRCYQVMSERGTL